MSSKRKSTLDQIAELLKPAPEVGSDDDLDFDTKARVIEDYEGEFSEDDTPRHPTLKQSAALDDDPRYTGKKISRRDAGITEDSGNESSVASDSEHFRKDRSLSFERGFKASGCQAESNVEDSIEENESGEEYRDSEDYGSESGDEDENSNMQIEDDEIETNEDPDSSFKNLSSTKSAESEIEKANAVRNQLYIWDNLLECRIHLQKCVISSNRLPKYEKIDAFKQEGGSEFVSEIKNTERSFRTLLDKFITLQETLVNNYSETKNLGQKTHKRKSNTDEEISSDSGKEEIEQDVETLTVKPPKKKKRHVEDFENVLSAGHKKYIEFRDTTIQKWNDRTRVITGKSRSRDFSAFEQSTLQQIRHILSNRIRLIQRTQVPRSIDAVLGDPAPSDNVVLPEHDPEIFDDSDFYHQLLRELIERRTEDSQDAAALGRRWAAIQKLRTKMKHRVDTRATKGRRLRYDPHQKLVGFMAPVVSSSVWNDKAVTELFNSLFGKKV